MNNLANYKLLKQTITFLILCVFLLSSFTINAQVQSNPNSKKYTIAEIVVTGNTSFSQGTVITYSGLRKGQEVAIPVVSGGKISAAIKKLWSSNLFSNIEVYVTKIEGSNAFLEIYLDDLPELKDVRVTGVKRRKVDEVVKENKLQEGTKVTENLITTTKNFLENKYRKNSHSRGSILLAPRYSKNISHY